MSTEDGTKITSEERSQVDGSQLTGELGVDAAEVQWRKEFTGFDESDRQQLSSMVADALDGAEEVRDAVDQIAAANEEQARRVEEVAESVDRLTTETDTGGE
jgi:heme-based aerotactic transducer